MVNHPKTSALIRNLSGIPQEEIYTTNFWDFDDVFLEEPIPSEIRKTTLA